MSSRLSHLKGAFFMAFDIGSKGEIPQPTIQEKAEEARKSDFDGKIGTTVSSGNLFRTDPNYLEMADFLGLDDSDRMDVEIAQKVAFIRDSTKMTDEIDARLRIKDMIRDLGLSSKGKDLVKSLYKYTRLYSERERIDKEISLIKNNVGQPQG